VNFLLDPNICSAYLRGEGRVFNRFMQHSGGLATSAIVVAELYSWVYRANTKPERLNGLTDLLSELQVLSVDQDIARRFGQVRAALLDQGRPTPDVDLLIGCTALHFDLTLVTHNVRDFSHIPDLRIDDWLSTS
jgi:tRNA(fMet)-specific endonuclease VapC